MKVCSETLSTVNTNMRVSNGVFKHLLVSVLICAVYVIVQRNFFRCPCTNHALYGALFMVVPALVLLALGFMMSQGFWKYLQSRNNTDYGNVKCALCMRSLRGIFVPFVGPIVWLVVGLLHGKFYVCAHEGPTVTCDQTLTKDSEMYPTELYQRVLHMQSQVLGFAVLLASSIIMLAISFIEHRNHNKTSPILPTLHAYTCLENEAIRRKFQNKIQEIADSEAQSKIEVAFQKVENNTPKLVLMNIREEIFEMMNDKLKDEECSRDGGVNYVQIT